MDSTQGRDQNRKAPPQHLLVDVDVFVRRRFPDNFDDNPAPSPEVKFHR
jgi:hypothetical protein